MFFALLCEQLNYSQPVNLQFVHDKIMIWNIVIEHDGPGNYLGFFMEQGKISAFLCQGHDVRCTKENILEHWSNITSKSIFEIKTPVEKGQQYSLLILPRDNPTELTLKIYYQEDAIRSRPSAEAEAYEEPVPFRLQKPIKTEKQNNQVLLEEVTHKWTQINTKASDISRQTNSTKPFFGHQMYPIIFTRNYLQNVCYETEADDYVFMEVLFKKAFLPKFLVVGHPRCKNCMESAPKVFQISYFKVDKNGLHYRELKPFEYDFDGPVEQVFELSDYGMNDKDEVVRFKVNYKGDSRKLCAYYIGIWGDPENNEIVPMIDPRLL